METVRLIGGEVVAFIARVLLRLLYGLKVEGTLPKAEKMLIISNHQSFLDGVIIGAFLDITPTYLIHTSIASRWYFKIPLAFIRHEVVDTEKPLAIKTLVNLVEAGKPVVIFPEGRITVTGALMKVYDGPAFVAAKTGCTVIPLHIDGAVYSPFSRMKGDFPAWTRPRIRMTIHPPASIPMPEGRTAKVRRRKAAEAMRRILQRATYDSRKPKPLFDSLLDAADMHGKDRDMMQDITLATVTYGRMIRNSLALGRLVSKFTREGETAGVLMPNVNATVFLLFGMWAMRRTPAMLNYTSGLEALQNACRLADLKVVFTSRAFVEKIKAQETVAKLPVKVLYLEDLRPQFTLFDKLWLILWASRNPRRVRKEVGLRDPAIVLFTSGSEGMPKGVVLAHDSIVANTDQIAAAYAFSSKEKFFTALPMFHAFGLTAGIVLPLLNGCPVFVYPSPLHYRMVPETIYNYDCTVMFSTNTFLANYAKVAHPYDFYSLKYLVVGAEKLTDDVTRLCMEKFGLRPVEGYGATECAPVIAVNTPLMTRLNTVGEVLPGIDYRVVPVEGIEEGGVLHVRGDNMMLGYLNPDKPGQIDPPHSEIGPGWYNTGDVVKIEEGVVSIQARMKRFAKVAGEMVSLEVVEKIAGAARPNGMHASTTLRETARGETILLFTQDPTLKREELLATARASGLPELAVPKRIIYLDRIPMLGNGKKDYVTLAQMAQERAKVQV
jgi:acyl-[acyl-carrier-protein]-phospholipid O-acyltransferase/long-chain-fatty-acid--[acyl-carrier-protein] ligase